MRLHSPFTRRPTPSLVISSLALFVSLGGVGYAAAELPNNSVGTSQIRNSAVTFKKIEPGSVGSVRANTHQLQVRVGGKCTGPVNGAIGAIDSSGKVTCDQTLPQEFSATVPASTLGAGPTPTPIQAVTLPAGASYLVLANPQVDVSAPGAAQVQVSCTLTALPSGNASQTRTATFTIGAGGGDRMATLPLTIAAPSSSSAGSAALTCVKTVASGTPVATVATSLNAIQTAANN